MNTLKQTLVCGLLVAFTVWPAVQIGLVNHYRLNPWKLGGWGMYSAPQYPQSKVQIICSSQEETYTLTRLDPQLDRVTQDFLYRHQDLRDLVEPIAVSQKVFELYPAIQNVRIEVRLPVLNRENAMVEQSLTIYDYDR